MAIGRKEQPVSDIRDFKADVISELQSKRASYLAAGLSVEDIDVELVAYGVESAAVPPSNVPPPATDFTPPPAPTGAPPSGENKTDSPADAPGADQTASEPTKEEPNVEKKTEVEPPNKAVQERPGNAAKAGGVAAGRAARKAAGAPDSEPKGDG